MNIQAWRDLSTQCTPAPRLPQTFIVGTASARNALSPTFSGLLRRCQSALTCDISTFKLMHKETSWRYVIVVNTLAQLRNIICLIQIVPTNLIIVGMMESEEAICAARMEALRFGGVGFVTGGKSLRVVQGVLEAWSGRGIVDEGKVKRAFGEASFGGKDVVVPPGWDSEGKIRAVVDALGLKYEVVGRVESTDMENDCEGVLLPGDEMEMRQEAAVVKMGILEQQQSWLRGLEGKLAGKTRGDVGTPAKEVERVAHAVAQEEEPVQSDFFQKLLHYEYTAS